MSNYSYIVPGKPLPHTFDTYPNTNRKRMAIVIKYNTTRKASKLTKTALKPNTGTSKRSFFSTFIIFRSIFFMEAILIQQRKRGLFTQKRRHSMDIRPRYTTAHHVIYLTHRNQFVVNSQDLSTTTSLLQPLLTSGYKTPSQAGLSLEEENEALLLVTKIHSSQNIICLLQYIIGI